MAWPDPIAQDQWDDLKAVRRQFRNQANDWLPLLSAGTATRAIVEQITRMTTNLLKVVLVAESNAADIQPVAREDLGDSTFDLAAALLDVKINAQAITLETEVLYNQVGGKLKDIVRAADGTMDFEDITVPSAATAVLQGHISATLTALSP